MPSGLGGLRVTSQAFVPQTPEQEYASNDAGVKCVGVRVSEPGGVAVFTPVPTPPAL